MLCLVGDSDIERWPKDLLPTHARLDKTIASGHSGATLAQILPHVVETIRRHKETEERSLLLVVCAGENDVQSLPLSETTRAFEQLLDVVSSNKAVRSTFVLGPKIEPWQRDDAESRKQYIQLSRMMERRCADVDRILFIDCLLMFCGRSAEQPGALLGGRAQADSRYFDADKLHLSDQGYTVWKTRLEEELAKMVLE